MPDFPTYPTTYLPSDGTPAQVTLNIAKQRADELGIQTILVASTRGATGLEAAALFQDYNLIVVSHSTGLRAPDGQRCRRKPAPRSKRWKPRSSPASTPLAA